MFVSTTDLTEDVPKYAARVLGEKSCGFGRLSVGVFKGDEQIGAYERNYGAFGEATFFPFEQDGAWYALYSKDYTATRVMSLPDCKDLGGEEPLGHGFCPTDYLVPELTGIVYRPEDPEPRVANHDHERWALKVPVEDAHGKYVRYHWPDDPKHPQPDEEKKAAYLAEKARTHKLADEWHARNPFVTRFAKWGFVGGCYWGDDSGNWKVEFLDLSEAAKGVVKRDQRFGYLQLGPGAELRTAINTNRIYNLAAAPEACEIVIAVPQRFSLAGRRVGEDEHALG